MTARSVTAAPASSPPSSEAMAQRRYRRRGCAPSSPRATSRPCARAARCRRSSRPTTTASTWSSSAAPGRARRWSPSCRGRAGARARPAGARDRLRRARPALGARRARPRDPGPDRRQRRANFGLDFLPGLAHVRPRRGHAPDAGSPPTSSGSTRSSTNVDRTAAQPQPAAVARAALADRPRRRALLPPLAGTTRRRARARPFPQIARPRAAALRRRDSPRPTPARRRGSTRGVLERRRRSCPTTGSATATGAPPTPTTSRPPRGPARFAAEAEEARRAAQSPFDYALVRVVPRVERDEFVNAGVIALLPPRAVPRRPRSSSTRARARGARARRRPRAVRGHLDPIPGLRRRAGRRAVARLPRPSASTGSSRREHGHPDLAGAHGPERRPARRSTASSRSWSGEPWSLDRACHRAHRARRRAAAHRSRAAQLARSSAPPRRVARTPDVNEPTFDAGSDLRTSAPRHHLRYMPSLKRLPTRARGCWCRAARARSCAGRALTEVRRSSAARRRVPTSRAWRSRAVAGAARRPAACRSAARRPGHDRLRRRAARLLRGRHRPVRGDGRAAPGIDVALLPVWGWGPSLGVRATLDPAHAGARRPRCCGRGSRSRSTGGHVLSAPAPRATSPIG